MEYAKESYLYNMFAIMLRTGMRSGEVRGLKYIDIDKKKNVIHVQRTLKYLEHKGFFEDTPKTHTSKRDIPLTKDTLAILEEQRLFWKFDIVKLDRYLFCNENGAPLSRERVQGEIDRTIRRIHGAGYEFDRITSHVFRHPYVKHKTKSFLRNSRVFKADFCAPSHSLCTEVFHFPDNINLISGVNIHTFNQCVSQGGI